MNTKTTNKETKEKILLRIEPSTLDKLDELALLVDSDRSKLIRKFIDDGLSANSDFQIRKLTDGSLKEIHELKTEVHKIGVNINQIARAGVEAPNIADMDRYCKSLAKLLVEFEKNFVARFEKE